MHSFYKFAAAFALLALIVGWSCSSPNKPFDESEIAVETAKFTCVECHTDAVQLQELATPEPPPSENAGEG